MTTAVYCHKTNQIAIDSRLSMNTRIISDEYNKVFERAGWVFFTSGSIHDIPEAVDLWFSTNSKWKGDKFSMLVVSPDKSVSCFYSYEGLTYRVPVTYNDAVGSGCDWALAALDFKCNVVDALQYAMKKDCATGGVIRLYDILEGCWLVVE